MRTARLSPTLLESQGRKVIRISKDKVLENGYFADGSKLIEAKAGKRRVVADLAGIGSLRGKHNAQNALAAFAAARAVGLGYEEIKAGFRSFAGLAHRMEQVGKQGNVLFVNDSKATNAEAAAPALSSFPRIYWIAGGLAKEGGIDALERVFSDGSPRPISSARPRRSLRLFWARPRLTRFPARWPPPSNMRRATRPMTMRASLLCCSRRPVRVLTSSRILRNAAMLSGRR